MNTGNTFGNDRHQPNRILEPRSPTATFQRKTECSEMWVPDLPAQHGNYANMDKYPSILPQLSTVIIHQIFLLTRDWPKRVT